MRTIINADDLGLSKGVNEGIVHCYEHGIVNSSTLLTNYNHFEHAVALIEKHQLQNIGVHFNLTEGKPLLTDHRTIVDKDGSFLRNIFESNIVDEKEVVRELEAQLQKAFKAGININHLDSHHHVHMTSKFRKIFVHISKKYNLPLRKISNTLINPFKMVNFYKDINGAKFFTTYFSADFYGENATENTLIHLLKKYKGKSVDIMCHPGYIDNENGHYNEEREMELKVLTTIKRDFV